MAKYLFQSSIIHLHKEKKNLINYDVIALHFLAHNRANLHNECAAAI